VVDGDRGGGYAGLGVDELHRDVMWACHSLFFWLVGQVSCQGEQSFLRWMDAVLKSK
jgi:hypothetical protein